MLTFRDMLGRSEAVSVEKALRILLDLPLVRTEPEAVRIEDAYGRILCSDLSSPEDMPGFSRSSMDGFAVKASDTFGCSENLPAYLLLKGEVTMGEPPRSGLKTGEAIAVPTGGMLPGGSDAVVMSEYVQKAGGDMIEVLRPVAPGENVIGPDEDIAKGEIVFRQGHRFRPQDIAALAGLGITAVSVFKRPSVAIISTGDEIVPPGSSVKPGQVRDINSYNLAGLISDSGGIPVRKGIFRDDYDLLHGAVQDALEADDMVVVTGGSSVGIKDMTSKLFEAIDPGSVLFHGVAIKPGKPLIAGFIRGKPVFGLPGHPAAVTVSFMNFVQPVLLRIGGYEERESERHFDIIEAKTTKNISSAAGREDHIRASVYVESGELLAEPIPGKSGLIRTLVRADGVVVVPSDSQGIAAGEIVKVRIFRG